MDQLSGGEMLIRALHDEGVDIVFGYPGGAVLHIYDAIFNQDKVEHILVRHEQAATHAADGYARSTGKPGVVLVTSGPGATNAVTGIATAYMDSIPMIVISSFPIISFSTNMPPTFFCKKIISLGHFKPIRFFLRKGSIAF